ncbi:hypothetical protein A9239_08515 [Methanosarcina sp. A14]|nr:hypothetical protein A9239_08515 [Methanosarcina sp. A14]
MLNNQIFRVIFCIMKLSIQNMMIHVKLFLNILSQIQVTQMYVDVRRCAQTFQTCIDIPDIPDIPDMHRHAQVCITIILFYLFLNEC